MAAVEELSQSIPLSTACDQLALPRSTYYRLRSAGTELSETEAASSRLPKRDAPRVSGRKLELAERQAIRDVLNSPRFVDCNPYVVYATLLDEGVYLCSVSTMYRILSAHDEVRERRNQRKLPLYKKPELLASQPNQLWSWDISWLRGARAYVYYYLYVILDVFSRYVVGWTIAEGESAETARALIEWACRQQGIEQGALTLHSDNGSPMKSLPVAHLLEQLGVANSHSRPYVSNDNPFSEAQFKTMKYRPDYPDRFASAEEARGWARPFFQWYNGEHLHSGIGYMTPAALHFGHAQSIVQQRQAVLDDAFTHHPERFVRGQPHPPDVPTQLWINQPAPPGSPEKELPFSILEPEPLASLATERERTG